MLENEIRLLLERHAATGGGPWKRPFATALFAALGAWGFLRSAVNGYNDRGGSTRAHDCVLGECGR